MNKNNLRTAVVAAAFLLLAGMIFLACESHGKAVESRFGMVAIVVILILLIIGAVLNDPNNRK